MKRFLYEVEGTTVLFEEVLKNKLGRGISAEKICTGCQSLCNVYFDTENKIF